MNHKLEVVETLLEEIEQHPDNANNGDLSALKESIETNGFFSPIIVQATTGYIIAGNHRYQFASELGMVTIPAIFLDVDEEQAKRALIAHVLGLARGITDLHDRRRERGRLRRAVRAARDAARREWRA